MAGDRPAASGFTPAPTGFVFRSQTRPSTPTESSSLRRPIRGRLCYGLVVLVALLSTPDCSDAVTVRYRTVHHRTEADFHRPIPSPSQAHERDRLGRRAARPAQPPLTLPALQRRPPGGTVALPFTGAVVIRIKVSAICRAGISRSRAKASARRSHTFPRRRGKMAGPITRWLI